MRRSPFLQWPCYSQVSMGLPEAEPGHLYFPCTLFLLLLQVYFFYFEREREREREGGAERD